MPVLLKKLGLGFCLVLGSVLTVFKGFVDPTLCFDLSDYFLCELFSDDFDEVSFWPKRLCSCLGLFCLVALNKFPVGVGVSDELKIEAKSFLAGWAADWEELIWTPNKFVKGTVPYFFVSSFLPDKFKDGICFIDVYSLLVLLTGAKARLFVVKGFEG